MSVSLTIVGTEFNSSITDSLNSTSIPCLNAIEIISTLKGVDDQRELEEALRDLVEDGIIHETRKDGYVLMSE